ncbi:MAG: SpoIIE family protein phosphatase [Edaphobacter sp.]
MPCLPRDIKILNTTPGLGHGVLSSEQGLFAMHIATLSYTDADGQYRIDLDRDSTSIGRSPNQDIVLDDACVSRHHAVIERRHDAYVVIDQKSTHGTFLNSVRIERASLKSGDVLQLGSMKSQPLQFHLKHTSPTTSALSQTRVTDLLSSLSEFRLPSVNLESSTREMEKLNWLLRAARQLNEGGAIDDILSAFLHLTLQLTGMERGFVFLRTNGEMRHAHGLDANGKTLEEDSTLSRRAIQKAIESGSKFTISDTTADDRASGWSSVFVNKIRSIYCIPLRKRASVDEPDRLLGLLYLDSQLGLKDLTRIDHQLLDTIAAEAATLLHNALLAQEESKARHAREELLVAANIHSSLMAMKLPVLPYAEIHARSVPCLAIGGDFYDAVALDDCVCVTVADVSGKGVSAAIVAATLQGIIHSQFLAGRSLPEIATIVNQFLVTRNVGKYATMILLKLFPDGRIEHMNCGHLQPLVVRGTQIRRLEEANVVVGLLHDVTYASTHDVLQPGEKILLATDGITEAEDPAGNQFGDTGLNAIVHYEGVDAIIAHVADFQAPNDAQDDCTLLEIRYIGNPH